MAKPQPIMPLNQVPLWKIIAVSLGAIAWVALLNTYRWAIPSQFGFTPSGVCTNTEVLERFLAQGGNPNTKVTRSRTSLRISLLECALLSGRKDLMRLVIEHKADLDQRSQLPNRMQQGGTALHWAVFKEDTAAAILLLEAGADVNARFDYLVGCAFCSGSNDMTALHLAAKTGQVAMIELLLNYGAIANSQDGRGQTPLQVAAQYRNEDAIALLDASDSGN